MGKALDLTGMRFGKLTVIGVDPDWVPIRGRHKKWVCQCDCGQTKIVQSNHLTDGSTQACSSACKHRIEYGTKIGNLTVLDMTDNRHKVNGSVIYNCLCSCGNQIAVSSTELRANRRTSCPQCTESNGVRQIKDILNKNNIDFVQEYVFKDCINPSTNKCLRFDFFIPNKNYLIEYDGIQHSKAIEFWGGEEGLKQRQILDNIKNNYCKDNNIALIRIPYTVEKITLEDIQPETSQYLCGSLV